MRRRRRRRRRRRKRKRRTLTCREVVSSEVMTMTGKQRVFVWCLLYQYLFCFVTNNKRDSVVYML